MNDFDGNAFEMPEHRPVDDGMIEAALAGSPRGQALDALSSFVSSVRSAVEAVPTPSTAMAAVLAAGFSTEKGDLSATAASNVNGPAAQEAGLSKWRKAKMKIQGFLAGLGVVGKVALGVGVAAAATTGAGATGMLPFSIPGTGHAHHHRALPSSVSTTTSTSTPIPLFGLGTAGRHTKVERASTHGHGTGGHTGTLVPTVSTTTTTASAPNAAPEPNPTSTTAPPVTVVTTPATTIVDPPSSTTTPTTMSTTTSTTTPTQPPSQSIQLSCVRNGPTQVTCTWNASPTSVAKYALWRWTTGGDGSDYGPVYQSANGLTFVDNNVTPGVPYTYRVFTTLGNGASGPWSNRSYIT